MCVRFRIWSNSANIVQQFTIDTVRLVNSVFKQHHMAVQMCARHWTYQRGFSFFFFFFFFFFFLSQHLPPLFCLFPSPSPSSLHLSLSLCPVFVLVVGQRSAACAVFISSFHSVVGFPWWLCFPFPPWPSVINPSLGTQRPTLMQSHSQTLWNTWVFCPGPRSLSVMRRWKYHVYIQIKMPRLLLCLVLHAHISYLLILLPNNTRTDSELASLISHYQCVFLFSFSLVQYGAE